MTVDDSWKDEVAQGSCSGLQTSVGWMFAVRRTCSDGACADICASLAGQDGDVSR